MGRRIGMGAVLALLALPAVAWADKQIEAGPPNRFTTPEITMDQGEKLTFHNGDTVSHDVTATGKGPDGKPLFRTPNTDAGKTTTVDGSQYLTSGHYEYLCSIHPNMKGTIHVTGNGTAVPRPGSSGSSGSTNSNDKAAPVVAVRLASRHLRTIRRSHKLSVVVNLNEPAHVELRAIARPKVGGKLVTVATGSVHMTKAGAKRVRLRLTKAGRAAMLHRRSLAVIVTGKATDNAGNKASEQHGRTLRV